MLIQRLLLQKQLREREPGSKITFFVTQDGVENKMVEEAGYERIVIKASRLPRHIAQVFSFGFSSISAIKLV